MDMIENPVPWPGGARVAVCYTFDFDADSLLNLVHPDDAANRVSATSYFRYDATVAIKRICKLFEHHGVPLTFFVPGWCAEEYPHAIERILEGGHEVGHHGYLHENPNQQTRDREHYWTNRGVEAIERFTGRKPRGCRAPMYNFSKHSIEILTSLGFEYDASLMGDDVPFIIQGRNGGELVEIPSYWPLDDAPHYLHSFDLDYVMPIQPPRLATEVYMSEFNSMWKHRGIWVCTFHPYITGRPARLDFVEQMIKDMRKKGKVWFASMEEVSNHVRKLVDDGAYTPRIDKVPYKQGRIGELEEGASAGRLT
ncbi:MAG: polysaccharide deacetylase [Proteobacteria bacterium]|nr:polysaccharide deacetylase [Pseudomonadota bacterium]